MPALNCLAQPTSMHHTRQLHTGSVLPTAAKRLTAELERQRRVVDAQSAQERLHCPSHYLCRSH